MHKNYTLFAGKVISIEKSHKAAHSTFYRYIVEIPRQSGAIDEVPFMISEKLLYNNPIKLGDYIQAEGEVRTINRMVDGKSRLHVFNFVHEAEVISESRLNSIVDKNVLVIEGYIVKPPIYRKTGMGRRITELIVAHNRTFNKESYIPTIAWGVDATFSRKFKVSDEVSIQGRFQSRIYRNREGETRTTYEISVNDINLLN